MARFLGIDATKTVVRTALIRTAYRRVVIEALGEADVIASGSERDAIRAAAGAIRPDGCAIALSGERTLFRRLDLPAAAQRELASVLSFELEATVPFEMDEAVFDYRVLKRVGGATAIPVLAAVARMDDVRERIAVVREAIGIEPEHVGTGALPLANLASLTPELDHPVAMTAPLSGAAPRPAGPIPIAIVDLSEATSDFVVLLGGEPVFVRTLSRGTIGLPGTAYALGRELRQTLSAWRAIGGEPITTLYLVGGGASTQGAESFLSSELGVSILPLPPPQFEGLSAEHASKLPRFAKAVGLAVGLSGRSRSLDLRQGPLEAQRSYPFLREKIPLFSGLGAVILASFGFSVVADLRSLDIQQETLTAELATTTQAVFGESTEDPDHARQLLEQGPGGADEDPMPRADAFDVMVELSKAVPNDLVHDVVELDVVRGHVTIQGTVPTIPDVEPIAAALKEHRCFKDVKVPRTSQFGQGKQKYVLELDIKCDEKKKKTAADGAKTDVKESGR